MNSAWFVRDRWILCKFIRVISDDFIRFRFVIVCVFPFRVGISLFVCLSISCMDRSVDDTLQTHSMCEFKQHFCHYIYLVNSATSKYTDTVYMCLCALRAIIETSLWNYVLFFGMFPFPLLPSRRWTAWIHNTQVPISSDSYHLSERTFISMMVRIWHRLMTYVIIECCRLLTGKSTKCWNTSCSARRKRLKRRNACWRLKWHGKKQKLLLFISFRTSSPCVTRIIIASHSGQLFFPTWHTKCASQMYLFIYLFFAFFSFSHAGGGKSQKDSTFRGAAGSVVLCQSIATYRIFYWYITKYSYILCSVQHDAEVQHTSSHSKPITTWNGWER